MNSVKYKAEIVDFLIYDSDTGKLFVQKRSGNRELFPNCWEFAGGHLEKGETHEQCLRRELKEETNFDLVKIYGKINEFFWSEKKDVINHVYLIEASGNFKFEDGKIDEYRWIEDSESGLLLKDGETTNGLYESINKAFVYTKGLSSAMSGTFNEKHDEISYSKFEPFINELADIAGEIALKYFRSDLLIDEKDDKSPVTIADKEIEQKLRDTINKKYPEHGIVGEEYGTENTDAEYVWVIDPIDGTKAFATGKPLFGTIIGLTHKGKPVVGLIDQAFTKERWVGTEGVQSTYNGNPIQVSKPRALDKARCYTAAPEMFHGDRFDNFEELRKSVQWMLYGSDCYAYGLMSMGQIDAVFEQYLGVHDIIGLVPIIKGAGGCVTDLNGNDISLDSNGTIMATNTKKLSAQMLSKLNCSL